MAKKTTTSSGTGGKSRSGVSEVKRFTSELGQNRAMLEEVSKQGGKIEAIIAVANKNGYNFKIEDAKKHLNAVAGRELADTELEAIALGKGSVTTNIVVFTQGVIATDVVVGGELAAVALAVTVGVRDR